ncbi:MAG: cytochrome c family protein [Bacteroidetes bacterium]|nr:cytochrome c family protein [Bacteroidota bacterium]
MRCVLAAAAVVVLVAAGFPAEAAPSTTAPSKTAVSKAALTKAATPEIPPVINIPSSVGEVVFRHQMHVKNFSIKCVDCHHQINARRLTTPHPDYFGSSWINCKTCHHESEKTAQNTYVCKDCHRTRPKNIVDETLSAKVVIHKQCWKCHEVGTGKEASNGCEKCHSGKKRS